MEMCAEEVTGGSSNEIGFPLNFHRCDSMDVASENIQTLQKAKYKASKYTRRHKKLSNFAS
jgi:hypothetical protein